MGKVKSERQVRREGKGSSFESDNLLVSFTPISLLLTVFALIGEGYITAKYLGSDPYANWSLILLVLGIIGVGGVLFLTKGVPKFQYRFLEEPTLWILYIVMNAFILTVAWFVAKTSIRYALSTTDLYFYYISTAIIEELFFRMFLCSFLKLKTSFHPVIIILISAVLFTLIHIEAYANQPYSLGVMFFGGVIFASFYLYFKDVTITMLSHIVVNIVAVWNFTMSV